MSELQEIHAKYNKHVTNTDNKTMRIEVDDYIALYNMAEYSEIIEREQEEERNQADLMDRRFFE